MKKDVEVAFKKQFEGWQDTPSSERHQCWVLERPLPSWIWQITKSNYKDMKKSNNSYCLLRVFYVPGTILGALNTLCILAHSNRRGWLYHSHFIEEIEAQGKGVAGSRPHNWAISAGGRDRPWGPPAGSPTGCQGGGGVGCRLQDISSRLCKEAGVGSCCSSLGEAELLFSAGVRRASRGRLFLMEEQNMKEKPLW